MESRRPVPQAAMLDRWKAPYLEPNCLVHEKVIIQALVFVGLVIGLIYGMIILAVKVFNLISARKNRST